MKVRLNSGDSDGCEYRRGSFSIVLRMSIIGSNVCGRRNQTDDSLRHSLMVIVSLLASQMSSTNASKSLRNCSAKSRRILICSSDLANSSSSICVCLHIIGFVFEFKFILDFLVVLILRRWRRQRQFGENVYQRRATMLLSAALCFSTHLC